MNSNESDVLDVDFDPDLLIHLLGKLKLDSIPEDISDTLSSIENRTEENICNRGFEAQNLAIDPVIENLQNNAIAREQNKYTSIQDVSTSSQSAEKSKNSFFSAIGVVSGSSDDANDWKKSDNSHQEVKIQKESSTLQAKYSTATQHEPKEDIYPTCDSLDFHWQRFPFSNTSSSRSFGCFPLLKKQGKVFDIQLNDSESIKSGLQRLPFLPYEEISGDGSDKSIHNDDTYIQEYGNTNSLFSEPSTSSLNRTVCIQENDSNDSTYDSLGFSKQNCNSLTKSISSQDSGYDTSSTISPSPPFLSTETFNSDDFCHDEVDEQLESLLAGLVEVENSLLLPISPTNNSKVPVLKNAINPEDHKEKIVNFLKESPSIDSVQVSVILSNENSNTSETVENISEKDDENSVDTSTCRKSPYSSKKSSFKAKDRILGYEFKYASKDDDGQIFIYKKGSINEKNKILKQIQDNERVHKIKLIRLLGRSLKRANDDDRENVKRRRLLSSKTSNKGTQLKDSCL